jgi:hypothetical protein
METSVASDRGTTLARGAVAGGLATGAMTGVMLGAQRAGLLGKMPPLRITERLFRRLHPATVRGRRKHVLAAVSHLGFGIAAGALYGGLAGRMGDRRPSLLGALGFGGLVWAGSYAGWLPRLGLMPPPHRDRPGRQSTMLLAHLVYGAVLFALAHRRV